VLHLGSSRHDFELQNVKGLQGKQETNKVVYFPLRFLSPSLQNTKGEGLGGLVHGFG
jgi:hypothetical protein